MKRLPLIMCILYVAAVVSCSFGVNQNPQTESVIMRELPATDVDEDIVHHSGYTASYNHVTLCPNWVAWELTSVEANGQYNNQYSFSMDPTVKRPKAMREDYSQSGWDKGHMAPRADMKWSEKALEESYYFTNICPQNHDMNAGTWRKIEELTRRTARHYGKVWVVCGPIFDSIPHQHIGKQCVHVPDRFFKALAIQTSETEFATVGFLVDNTPQNGTPRRYATTVDSVEVVVGRDLFPTLPETAEATFDWNIWK